MYQFLPPQLRVDVHGTCHIVDKKESRKIFRNQRAPFVFSRENKSHNCDDVPVGSDLCYLRTSQEKMHASHIRREVDRTLYGQQVLLPAYAGRASMSELPY